MRSEWLRRTRMSLAPCTTSSGARIAAAWLSGDRSASREALLRLARIAEESRPEAHLADAPIFRPVLDQAHHVGNADPVDRGDEDVGSERGARERRIAAIARAHDRDAFGIGNAALDRPTHAVDQVVVHLAGELARAGEQELASVSGRAAVIDLQHGVAAVGEELDRRIVAPMILRPW